MDLFNTEKRQGVYDYLQTDKGRKSIQVFTTGLMGELKKTRQRDTNDVGATMELIDKVLLSVKLSKTFDYAIIPKSTCKQLLDLMRDIMRMKALKMALYVFKGDNDLSQDVQKALYFTLTGEVMTTATANGYFNFLDQPLYMTVVI